MTNLIGQSLGRYHILEQLGEGGMATVYKAYDTRLERDVAIKIIRLGAFPAEQLERILKRFDQEAKALARLTHPNIVSVIDYGEFEGAPFLVMTYLPGGTLKLQIGKSMPWQEAVKLLLPIAGALDYAHSQSIIHRDIKPSNILLTQRSQPMLSDFGIAKILESEVTTTLTGTGVGVGTPGYMAPEQWTGQAGPLSDVYSLGVVLYELVTGRKPYTADTPAAIMLKQSNDPLPRPRQFVPDLPEGVEKVLFKALAKRPEDRYQSMSEFSAALEQLIRGQIIVAEAKLEGRRKDEEEETLLAGDTGKKEVEEPLKVPVTPDAGQGVSKWGRWAAIGGLVALVTLGAVLGIGLLNRWQISLGSLTGLETHTAIPNLTFSRTEAPTPSQATTPSTEPTPFPAITLNKIRSFEYLIWENTDSPGIYAAIASSRADLIILGGGSFDSPLSRASSDPTRSKLVFAYLNIREAAKYMFPNLFAGVALPAWFGHQDPIYSDFYTVQYWNAAWESAIFSNIDKIIGRGYDGIFLQGVYGASDWSAGNGYGNPVYADAVSAMATLLSDIRIHIKNTYPGKTIYLAGDGPVEIAIQFPAALQNLDVIFVSCAYYCPGATSDFNGVVDSKYISTTLAPLYLSTNVPVFGVDYPTPLTDPPAVFRSFEFYTSLGWIPSVNNPQQDSKILTSGPFMFMAVPANTAATGYKNFVNYISGGRTASATLIGGDQGDYFIGGPGQNTIIAGAGNDKIYAHPKEAAYRNKMVIRLSSTIKNGTTPSVSILVNGKVVVQSTPITVDHAKGTQEFIIDATPYSSISSVSLIVTNTSYVDVSNYSNVEIDAIIFDGKSVDLSSGTYSNGHSDSGLTYSNNGTVKFPGSSFTSSLAFLMDTSDVIDGGGGINTVIYRGLYSNYSITQLAGGSWLITSGTTAEGPDKLTNIQKLIFSDKQIALP
jgi:serine/threonine protein kinase